MCSPCTDLQCSMQTVSLSAWTSLCLLHKCWGVCKRCVWWRFLGLQHLQWLVEVTVLPTSYEMLMVHLSKASGKKNCRVYGRCLRLWRNVRGTRCCTRLLCLSLAADKAPCLLPLVPLRWVVHVSKIHRWCRSLEALFTPPWCAEAEFRRCRKLPVPSWYWDPRPFPGMGKGSPSLSFALSSKTKNWAYSFWGPFWSSHWGNQPSCVWCSKFRQRWELLR